ncbi:Hypothetical protein A7982_10589 [Minicystis rosea]|nr:Hypothetical protein A7982_10589 [Minicystis rosea]
MRRSARVDPRAIASRPSGRADQRAKGRGAKKLSLPGAHE